MKRCSRCNWISLRLVQISAQSTLWHWLCTWCGALFLVVRYVEGCPDCESTEECYTVTRVRRTIRRITKAAMMPELGDEIINAIEKPSAQKGGKY